MRAAVTVRALGRLLVPAMLVPEARTVSAAPGDLDRIRIIAFEHEATGERFTALLTDDEITGLHVGATRTLKRDCADRGRRYQLLRTDGVWQDVNGSCCDVIPLACEKACEEPVSWWWLVRRAEP